MKLAGQLAHRDVGTVHNEVIAAEPAPVYAVAIEADLARASRCGRTEEDAPCSASSCEPRRSIRKRGVGFRATGDSPRRW